MYSTAPNQKPQHCRAVHIDQISATMQLLSGKWKLQIVTYLLDHGSGRFSALQRGIAPISPRVLSRELQDLQESHIITRTKADGLIAVDYQLTPIGKMLKQIIDSATEWGLEYRKYLLVIAATSD